MILVVESPYNCVRKNYLTKKKRKQAMVNKIYLIILVCFFSCKKTTEKEIAFFPNINILVSDLKGYKKIKIGGLSYQKRDKDTLTTYGFCSYSKTTCAVDWEVFFAKKYSLKIFDLLEKKGIQA